MSIFQKITLLSIGLYLFVQIPIFFQKYHFFHNLEPYPDGLLYTLSARNFTKNFQLQLIYEDSTIPYWVAPIYSIVLIPLYLISDNHLNVLFANLVMGVVSIIFLARIVFFTTNSILLTLWALLTYISHGFILWIAQVPMAENLALMILIVALHLILVTKINSAKTIIFSCLLAGLLVSTKYSLSLIATFFILLGLRKLRFSFASLSFQNPTSIAIIFFGLLAVLLLIAPNLWSNLALIQTNGSEYFSLDRALPNASFYFRSLFGIPTTFLWIQEPLTSSLIFVFFLSGCLISLLPKSLITKKFHSPINYFNNLKLCALMFVSQFPILLTFYTSDSRYILYSIPIIIVGTACVFKIGLIELSIKRLQSLIVICISLTTLIHLCSQGGFLLSIVKANFFSTTTAWQKESILGLDQSLKKLNTESQFSFLVTAIPPFLFDTYASDPSYLLLPLSAHQEFIAKGEWVWGSKSLSFLNEALASKSMKFRNTNDESKRYSVQQFDSPHLMDLYTFLLVNNYSVYISNAYVTHQYSVTEDFESIKRYFNLTPITENCRNACNLYRLSLKETSKKLPE